jgi:hypothetical protein
VFTARQREVRSAQGRVQRRRMIGHESGLFARAGAGCRA